MAGERIAEVLLKFKVDRTSLSQVTSANDRVTSELSELAQSAGRSGDSIREAFSGSASGGLSNRIREAGGEIRDAREEADGLRDSLVEAGRAAQDIRPPSGGGGGGGDTPDRAGAVDQAFGRASSIISGLGGGELANAAGLIADISAGFKELPSVLEDLDIPLSELGPAALIAGPAIALLAVGIANFQQVTAEARANLESALVAQQNYYQAVATLDEEGARQRISDLERQIEAQRQLAEEARNAADSAFNQLASQIGDAGARAFFAVDGTAQQLVATANEAESGLSAMEQEVTRLQQGLDEGAFSANNAAEAQDTLATSTEQATQATLSAINQRINDELEYARLSESASAESIQRRIEENQLRQQLIEEQIASLEALAAAGDTVAQQALPELRQQLEGLRADTERLSGDVLSSAQARERQEASTQAAEDAAKAAKEAERNRQRATEESANAVAQSEDKINQIRQDAAQKAIDLARQREDSIRKATEDADKAFRELAKKNNKAIDDENKRYKEGEAKAVEQYRRDELKSQQQHQKDRLRAQQDLQDSLLSAEEDNDVIAFIRAKRSGDEQLKRMDEDAQEETRIRGEQFAQERADAAAAHAEKLEQIKQATIEERDAIMARKDEAIAAANAQFDEQSRRLQEQTQQAIAREREQLQRSLENIRQKYNVEQTAGRQAAETIKQAFLAAAQAVKSQVDAAGKGGGKGGWDTSDKGFGDKGGSKGGGDKGFGDKGGGSKGGGKGNSSFGQVGGKKKGFFQGGIVPAGREVIGRFEPNRSTPEAVLPLDPATIERVFTGVFGGRGSGGSNITVNVGNVTVPESSGVTIQDVKVAVETGVYAALEGINEARAGA